MILIEVEQGRFINFKRIFKIDLIQVEGSDRYYVKFFSDSGEYGISQEFANENAARDWLSLSLIRSSGSHEILEL